jgi:hypothetical protein
VEEMRTRRDLTWHGRDKMVFPAKLAVVLRGVIKETESMMVGIRRRYCKFMKIMRGFGVLLI